MRDRTQPKRNAHGMKSCSRSLRKRLPSAVDNRPLTFEEFEHPFENGGWLSWPDGLGVLTSERRNRSEASRMAGG